MYFAFRHEPDTAVSSIHHRGILFQWEEGLFEQ